MRILTFLHSFEPGGVERTALALVGEWQASGAQSLLWLGRRDGAMADRLPGGVDPIGPNPSRLPVAWFETLWMLWHLPAAVRVLQPDVLFCAGNSYSIVAGWLKWRLGCGCPPIIAKISNDLHRADMSTPVRWIYHRWLRLQGRFLDHPVAMESAMVAEIATYLGRLPADVAVIEDPSIRTDQLRLPNPAPAPARTSGRRFVAMGRLAAQKDYRLMINAFAEGCGLDDRLTIYGEGPDRAMLTALIARLELSGQVTLAGWCADPIAALAQHDIFLLSSAYEGVPAVVIEALACGLPIIATDCSASMATLLDHGQLGQIVPTGDVDALTTAIAWATPGSQHVAAAHVMASRFTVERASQAYLALFQRSMRATAADAALPLTIVPSPRRSPLPQRADQPCC